MSYDDSPTPARPARSIQGQRCPSCGHLEADAFARFCGVCGGALGQGGHQGAGQPGGPAAQRPPMQHEPAVRYGTVAPPMQSYPPGPIGQPGPFGQPAPVERPDSVLYTVPSIGFGGPARIGAAVSAGFGLLPCVLFGFIGAWLVHWARDLVESWQSASVKLPIPLVNADLGMNFVELMHLRPILDKLIYWDERLWLVFAIMWLVPWVVWILAGAFFGVLLAAIYNIIGKMGGGVQVRMVPKTTPEGGQAYAPAGWQVGGPPQGAPGGWQGPPGPRR
jgi:hypothetical protein